MGAHYANSSFSFSVHQFKHRFNINGLSGVEGHELKVKIRTGIFCILLKKYHLKIVLKT